MCAAPNSIPYGSKVVVPGVGTYTVQDRGGGIHMIGNVLRIDVYFPTHAAAFRFGVKTRRGYVVK